MSQTKYQVTLAVDGKRIQKVRVIKSPALVEGGEDEGGEGGKRYPPEAESP